MSKKQRRKGVKRNMKVVILCGGQGTRLREETEFKPKPMVEIGDLPILCHIMKIYSHYGFKEFILCLGYKGDIIKKYFLNYEWMTNDFTLNIQNRMEWVTHFKNKLDNWKITFADTGEESLTAKRLKMIEKYIDDDDEFMLTYGDGVADIDLDELLAYHKKHSKLATITGINPLSRFGVLDVKNGEVKDFREKPMLDDHINAGFMVLNKKILSMIDKNSNTMLVDDTLPKLAREGELAMYSHNGFWHCMDTYRDSKNLNKMWNSGNAPWKLWD